MHLFVPSPLKNNNYQRIKILLPRSLGSSMTALNIKENMRLLFSKNARETVLNDETKEGKIYCQFTSF
ncbi:MAG: hypothetical protein EBR01_03820 [Proteobacteria bacterium]|nr:hypothetical protein [Pseudomonadota bacterium]NBY19611.1 hypothetical protein [bacterium]